MAEGTKLERSGCNVPRKPNAQIIVYPIVIENNIEIGIRSKECKLKLSENRYRRNPGVITNR
jgi:hypothetical protein